MIATELKFNYEYNETFNRLTIKSDKKVSDLKRQISEKINLDYQFIGIGFEKFIKSDEITDEMSIEQFNINYKYLFYVINTIDHQTKIVSEPNVVSLEDNLDRNNIVRLTLNHN